MSVRHCRVDRSPDEFGEEWWARPAVAEFRAAGQPEGESLSRAAALSRANDAFLCWHWDEANVTAVHRRLLERLL